jgi:C-terminal processing protease CtpA/Prc
LKIGDKIIKIDNFDTSNITDDEYCNLLSYLRTKQSLNITVKRGNKNFEYTLN